jgi:peptide/nickel transport system substrate-binding protein
VTLVAFDGWHGGTTPIKNLVMRVLPDPTTSVIALEKGEVDMLLEVPVTERSRIESNSNLKLYETSSHRFYYVGFNTRSQAFGDRRRREAVAKAIDREGIRIVASEETGFPAQNHLTKTIFGFAPDVQWYEQDVESAKKLMQEAGKSGLSVRLVCMEGPAKKAAQVVQGNLREIGIGVNIEVLERGALIDSGKKGDFDMMIHAWSTPVPDADYTFNFLYTSKMIGAMNYSFYNSKEADDLILQGEIQLDPNERLATYRKITELLKTDIPNIPVYFEMVSLAANKDLKNVVPSPSSTYYFYDLSW